MDSIIQCAHAVVVDQSIASSSLVKILCEYARIYSRLMFSRINELPFSGKFIGRIPFATTAMMNLGASNDGNISSSSPFTLKIDVECYESCKIQTTFLSNVLKITQLVCSKF